VKKALRKEGFFFVALVKSGFSPHEEADFFFLKTIIPSRKATREYLGGGKNHEKKR
jgi:hypothetical protein